MVLDFVIFFFFVFFSFYGVLPPQITHKYKYSLLNSNFINQKTTWIGAKEERLSNLDFACYEDAKNIFLENLSQNMDFIVKNKLHQPTFNAEFKHQILNDLLDMVFEHEQNSLSILRCRNDIILSSLFTFCCTTKRKS